MAGFAMKAMEKQRENGLTKKPKPDAPKNYFKNDFTNCFTIEKQVFKSTKLHEKTSY